MTLRDRRAIAIGTGLICVAVVAIHGVPWAAATHSALKKRASQQLDLVHAARIAALSLPALHDSLDYVLARFIGLAPRLVGRGSATEAAASLSGEVSLQAEEARLRVVELTSVPDSVTGDVGRVTVQTELEGDLAGLAAFLERIETGDPVLSVRAMTVQSLGAVRDPQVLRIRLDVCGWYLREAQT